MICALMTSVACAFLPELNVFLLRAFYSIADIFTSITFQDSKEGNLAEEQEPLELELHGLRFEWLPGDYEYVDGSEPPTAQRVDF